MVFTKFDYRVMECVEFNKDTYFTAKVTSCNSYSSSIGNQMLFEIIPLYSIGRKGGIVRKKDLQNYNKSYTIFVMNKVAEQLKQELIVTENNHLIIAFDNKNYYSAKVRDKDSEFQSMTLFPDRIILMSTEDSGVYHKPLLHAFPVGKVEIPEHLIREYNCFTIIDLGKAPWKTPHITDDDKKNKIQDCIDEQNRGVALEKKAVPGEVGENKRTLDRTSYDLRPNCSSKSLPIKNSLNDENNSEIVFRPEYKSAENANTFRQKGDEQFQMTKSLTQLEDRGVFDPKFELLWRKYCSRKKNKNGSSVKDL